MPHRSLVVLVGMASVALASLVGGQHPPSSGGTLKVLGARHAASDLGLKMFVPSGSVQLVTWDRDSIVVRGRVSPSDRLYFVVGDSSGRSAKIGVEARTSGADINPADLVVNVPRRTEISIKTVDATIASSGVGGWFYSVAGAIRLSGSVDRADVETIRGDVDLNVTAASVKARTGRGHMIVRGAPQDVDASTVGGALDVGTSTVLRGRFSSVTGDIRYAATPAPGSVFEFSDHAGTVDLLLPRAVSSMLELSSVTGQIENGFSQVRPVSTTAHALTLRLGAGDAHVTVRTFKGTIRLRSP
jgi:hypothetical protein